MMKTRLENLRTDETVREPIDRVFLCDFLKTVGSGEEDDVYLSIWDILKIWGYEDFYPKVLSEMYRLIENYPDENVCVHYDTGELNRDFERQKLLGWNIYNEKTKRFGLVGGILFHEGEMSLHT